MVKRAALFAVILGAFVALVWLLRSPAANTPPSHSQKPFRPNSQQEGPTTHENTPSADNGPEGLQQASSSRRTLDFTTAFQKAMDEHREKCTEPSRGICSPSDSRHLSRKISGRLGLHLLAKAYPSDSQAAAENILNDISRTHADTEAALVILAILAEGGARQAQNRLVLLGQSQNAKLASLTTEVVANFPNNRFYRDVFITMARNDNLSATASLVRFNDDATRNVLRELTTRASFIGRVAEKNLELQALLNAGQWPDTYTKLIDGSDEQRQEHILWAIDMEKSHPVESKLDTIRARLDKAKTKSWAQFQIEEGHKHSDSKLLRAAFNTRFATTYYAVDADPYYDDLLITYWTNGGRLSELETRHLHMLGYDCDPMERLAALLKD